jgi:glycosyltransferase involved in cell wall biosynthesis
LYGNVFAVPAARLARVPAVIASIRDSGVYLTDWTRRVQRAVCRLADHVLVNADAVKEWLVGDGYAADRISVVRNGIDLSRFLNPSPPPANLRQEFHVPEGVPILSAIARLCPSKGFDDLIDAMAIVARVHPDARLLIVGEGLRSVNGDLYVDDSYRLALRRRADALGLGDRVVFAGHRTDIPSILREVTLAVQPSRTEGLSNSVLESMAAGAAIVATPVGGTPEVITHDRSGWLVPARNPRALGEAIAFLLDQPERRQRLGETARQSVREGFSIEAMTNKTEDVYRSLLGRRPGRHSRAMRAA